MVRMQQSLGQTLFHLGYDFILITYVNIKESNIMLTTWVDNVTTKLKSHIFYTLNWKLKNVTGLDICKKKKIISFFLSRLTSDFSFFLHYQTLSSRPYYAD